MTEKRFKEIISTQKVIDNHTGKEYDCLLDNDLFDLINTIAEENEQLKIQIDDVNNESIGYEEQIEKLLKKNEQLSHDATVLICSNQEYRKENEQLREEIKDLNDVLARYEEKELKE